MRKEKLRGVGWGPGGVSPLLLEVRKGSLGNVPGPPTPSSFLRGARTELRQTLAGAEWRPHLGSSLRASLQTLPQEPERGFMGK